MVLGLKHNVVGGKTSLLAVAISETTPSSNLERQRGTISFDTQSVHRIQCECNQEFRELFFFIRKKKKPFWCKQKH